MSDSGVVGQRPRVDVADRCRIADSFAASRRQSAGQRFGGENCAMDPAAPPPDLVAKWSLVRREIDLGAGSVSAWVLADPDALLDSLTQAEFDRSDGRMPYWATLWPSALALAESVLRGRTMDGMRVLDLGCGLGLVGLAALSMGATVTFLDWERDAVRLALASAHAAGHGARATGISADWRVPPPMKPFDRVLCADVLYEARNGPAVARFLADHVADGGEASIADPGRLHAKDFLGDAARVGLELASSTSMSGREGASRIDVMRFTREPRAAVHRPVLLTAFEPFGGKDVNPSWEAIRDFEGTHILGHDVHVLRLPVVYGAVSGPLRHVLDRLRPEVVLSFGLGKGLHIERLARNAYSEAKPLDNAGHPPPSTRVADAFPAALSTTLPVDSLVAALRAEGLDAGPSDDAGGYLCNEEFFHLMAFVPDADAPILRRGFIHLPDLGVLDLASLRRVVRIAVATTLAEVERSSVR